MTLIVQKYGGTSVADPARIESVAGQIASSRAAGHELVVVVSAMAGETDRLLSLGYRLSRNPDRHELDVLLTSGEQVSIALLAIALAERGIAARTFTAAQVPILTDDNPGRARIIRIGEKTLQAALAENRIPVVAGYQGVNAAGRLTSLGRGGTDTTAVAIAAALKARECQIYTDVDGVYTTDPRVEPQARRLPHITYAEMLEMAGQGSKVLQTRAVEFAGKYNVPVRVLSSFRPGPGTLVSHEDSQVEAPVISGIAFHRDEAQVTLASVTDRAGVAASILEPVAAAGIEVDMIVQNVAREGVFDISFTVHRNDYQAVLAVLEREKSRIQAQQIIGNSRVAKISLIGMGIRSHPTVAADMFRALAEQEIVIRMICASELKITVVVDEEHLETGVRTLHKAFGLEKMAKSDAGL